MSIPQNETSKTVRVRTAGHVQLAKVLETLPNGKLRVIKWQSADGRWAGPFVIGPEQVVQENDRLLKTRTDEYVVNRACSHRESVHVGPCSATVLTERLRQEEQQICQRCRAEEADAARRSISVEARAAAVRAELFG